MRMTGCTVTNITASIIAVDNLCSKLNCFKDLVSKYHLARSKHLFLYCLGQTKMFLGSYVALVI